MRTLHGFFLDSLLGHARERPRAPALRPARGDGSYPTLTWGEVIERVRVLAELLRRRGLGRGSRVALFAGNGPDWMLGYLGIHATGATVVPLDANPQRKAPGGETGRTIGLNNCVAGQEKSSCFFPPSVWVLPSSSIGSIVEPAGGDWREPARPWKVMDCAPG